MANSASQSVDSPIEIGSINNGDSEGRAWSEATRYLALAALQLGEGVETPLWLNVVVFVDGPNRPNTFDGVRTGSYLRKKNVLIVQAAVSPKAGDDKRAVLLALLQESVDVAEQFARRKGIAEALPGIRGIVGQLLVLAPAPVTPPSVKVERLREPTHPVPLNSTTVPGGEEWSVRLTTETGQVWDDPSEDLVLLTLEDIERGDEQFVIVGRLRDATDQTYIQTIRNTDGSYTVERREGSAEQHFVTRVDDVLEAHKLITNWAYGYPQAVPDVVWRRLEFSSTNPVDNDDRKAGPPA